MMPQVIKVGLLTVSDRCSQGKAEDEGGANLKALVDDGVLFKGKASTVTSWLLFTYVDDIQIWKKFGI